MILKQYKVQKGIMFAWNNTMFSEGDVLYVTDRYDEISSHNPRKLCKVFDKNKACVGSIFPRLFDEAIENKWIEEV